MTKKHDEPVAENPVLDDLEAKRSAPAPAAPEEAPKAPAHAVAEKKPAAAPAPPAAPQPIIEDLLKDKTFDPDGKVRTQLAEISATQGIGKPAPAHLVTADGKPVEQPA